MVNLEMELTTNRNTPTQTSSLGTGRTAALDSNYLPGGTSQTACAAGTYQASTGQSSCTDASAGYYVPTLDKHHKQNVQQEHTKHLLDNLPVLMLQQDIM